MLSKRSSKTGEVIEMSPQVLPAYVCCKLQLATLMVLIEVIFLVHRFESWFDFSTLTKQGGDEAIVAKEREQHIVSMLHQVCRYRNKQCTQTAKPPWHLHKMIWPGVMGGVFTVFATWLSDVMKQKWHHPTAASFLMSKKRRFFFYNFSCDSSKSLFYCKSQQKVSDD